MGQTPEFHINPHEMTPAHPAARIVTDFSVRALDRQVSQLNALDAKASFIGAASFALIAGFLTALATKPPTGQRLEDFAAATLVFAIGALASVAYAWWPRPVDIPPHPRGLREMHWNDLEESVLRAVADQIALTFDGLKTVERKKTLGIKFGIGFIGLASILGSLEVLLTIAGGTH